MIELAGHRPNAAEPFDYGTMVDHIRLVRADRTVVKLDQVQAYERYAAAMADFNDTLGNRMRALKERSGLSLGKIAGELEKPRSSIQRFFESDYKPGGKLSLEEAMMFIGVLVGKGTPAITSDEIFALTALNDISPSGIPLPGSGTFSPDVARVMAQAFARVTLQGRDPPEETVEALAKMIVELSELYQRDPAMRLDAPRTSGALQILGMQLSRPARGLQ